MIWIEIAFWILMFLLLHSYLVYPNSLKFIYWLKGKPSLPKTETKPNVIIVIAAFNEEAVIEKKLASVFASDYPIKSIQVWVGSDASTDRTDEIIQKYIALYPSNIRFHRTKGRTGKSGIMNYLIHDSKPEIAQDAIIIPTDANVMFRKDSIKELVAGFHHEKIGLVCARILNSLDGNPEVGKQEMAYIHRENEIKFLQGINWGGTIGAFGACYAIRASLLPRIPDNFLMEDFYISMRVLKVGYKVVLNPEAICDEDIPGLIEEEFKRKVRISTGNMQNLGVYYSLLWPPYKGVAYSFFSHKIIRWLGPFILIGILLTFIPLALTDYFYGLLSYGLFIGIGLLTLDIFLKRLEINIKPIRFLSYFCIMNYALLIGIFKYWKGVKTNAWNPTKRAERRT